MAKTAMQHVLSLVEQMYNNAKTPEVESAMNDVINIITQDGIPMEKEQIINAYYDAANIPMPDGSEEIMAEQYYNEEYNKQ